MDEDAARAYALSEADSPACVRMRLPRRRRARHRPPRPCQDPARRGARRGADGAPGARVLCLAQLALLALEQEDWDRGAQLAGRARDGSTRPDSATLTCALVFAVAAFARAHSGRVEKARQDVRASRRLLAMLTESTMWFGLQARIALARAELRLSDAAAARSCSPKPRACSAPRPRGHAAGVGRRRLGARRHVRRRRRGGADIADHGRAARAALPAEPPVVP